MASYNRTKRADRDREIADRQAEIDAIKAGTWPRDINDRMRWGACRVFVDEHHRREYVVDMCQYDIDYLRDVQKRIEAGDPSVAGWEA